MFDMQPQVSDDQFLSTFFCRALYDYRSQDNSSLSFYRGDIIEVLTQLESGWWDGLLGEERGWFPSNYVQPISDQEAEVELNRSEYSTRASQLQDSALDANQRLQPSGSEQEHDWLQDELDYAGSSNGLDDLAQSTMDGSGATSDFWVPRVTESGQVSFPIGVSCLIVLTCIIPWKDILPEHSDRREGQGDTDRPCRTDLRRRPS